MGRMHNPANIKVNNRNRSLKVSESSLNSRHNGLNNPINTENTAHKVNPLTLRQPSPTSDVNADSVIFAKKPRTPYLNFYNPLRQSSEANLFHTPSRIQDSDNPLYRLNIIRKLLN